MTVDYGRQAMTASVEPTWDAVEINVAGGGHFSWAIPVRFAKVQNHPDSQAYLYVKINVTAAAGAAVTDYDHVLVPGDTLEIGDNIVTGSVQIYSTAALVPFTGFTVKGWA